MFADCIHVKLYWPTSFTFGEKILKILKCMSGHLECSFDDPPKIFSPKFRKFFAQSSTISIKLQFFQEKLFPQNVPLDAEIAVSTTLAKQFSQSPKIFCFKSVNDEKNILFFRKKNIFSSKWSSKHVECSFDKPAEFRGAWTSKHEKVRRFEKFRLTAQKIELCSSEKEITQIKSTTWWLVDKECFTGAHKQEGRTTSTESFRPIEVFCV